MTERTERPTHTPGHAVAPTVTLAGPVCALCAGETHPCTDPAPVAAAVAVRPVVATGETPARAKRALATLHDRAARPDRPGRVRSAWPRVRGSESPVVTGPRPRGSVDRAPHYG